MTIQLDFLPDVAAAFLLMFARLGTMIMLLPALGESVIPMRFRLTIALALTLVLYPVGAGQYPAELTANPMRLLVLLGGELAIGFGIGLCAKMITSVLQIAGVIIANQSGLAFALGTDIANEGQQGALYGNFLSILAMTLVFVTDTHYLVIAALYDSFTIFPPGNPLPVGDFFPRTRRKRWPMCSRSRRA
ncbi:flagellar biosynthetic protein FliR [Roseibium salinum]|nr:flagellar biosynthetic protein FliR [Roseibium salinum]